MSKYTELRKRLELRRKASSDWNEIIFLNGILDDDFPAIDKGRLRSLFELVAAQSNSRHVAEGSPFQKLYTDLLNEIRPLVEPKSAGRGGE